VQIGQWCRNSLNLDANGKVESINNQQYASIDAMNKNFDSNDHGLVIAHEITEAYQGARISLRTGEAAAKAMPKVPNPIYDKAHYKASYQPPFKWEK
jgi:hypothetical protein